MNMFFQNCSTALLTIMAAMAIISFIVRGLINSIRTRRQQPKKWVWIILVGLAALVPMLYLFYPQADTISQVIGVGFFSLTIYVVIQAIKF